MLHLVGSEVEIRGLDQAESSVGRAETHTSNQYLPFRWVPPATGEQLLQSAALATVLLALREMGMSLRDARLIVDAIVRELVENIALYGAESQDDAPPHALIGASLVTVPPTPSPNDAADAPHYAGPSDAEPEAMAIRLLIGDSGKGLVARLSPHLPGLSTMDSKGGHPWEAAGTIAERTILWAFERWSTSDPNSMGPRLGTRGLWRVLRIIRTNGGAVLVRSADAFCGYAHGSEGGVKVVRESRPASMVGTMFDITVLPPPTGIDSHAITTLETGPAIDFRWVPVRADDSDMFDAVYKVAREHDVIMTVDGWGTRVSHERLVEILDIAARLASPSIMAVVVAGINPMHLHHAVDAIHHRRSPADSTADHEDDSFLLLDEAGKSVWCGGTQEVRKLLNRLLTYGPLRISDYPDTAGPRKLLINQARLVDLNEDIVSLAIRPADVVRQLQHMAQSALNDAIDHDRPGIIRGAYRTPTLRLTDRWIDVEEVVHRTIGIATAAFLLMQKVAVEVPQALHKDTHMVQVGPVTLHLSQAFMESAGLHGTVYVMADEFDHPAGVDRIRAGTEVILCCDILLTDNSVRRAVTEILSWGAVPRAIVVPIDGRVDSGSIQVHGTIVPVARLVRTEIPAPQVPPEEIVDIDPLLRTPVPQRFLHRKRDLLWERDAFLDGCAEQPRIIGLGHIERPAHGHFTVYLDAGKVIDSHSSFSEEVAERMASAALQWLDQPLSIPRENSRYAESAEGKQIVVCYPGLPDDYAGRIARLIARRIVSPSRPSETVHTLPVPRSVAGSRWAFPEGLDKFPSGCEVILTDWGCMNAFTIMQLIRLASEAGASRILGLVMMSQLHTHEERALTMIRAVSGRSNVSTRSPDNQEGLREENRSDELTVPTRVRFLTALGISAVPRGNCPLCRLAAQLSSDADNGLLPSPIREHARRLSSQLGPITREEAVNREADAFGAPVQTEEAVAYIRLRDDLVEALRSTSRSQSVADQVADLALHPRGLAPHAMIRLLAAERQWLKLPPLRFSDCQDHVAQVAYAVAGDGEVNEQLRLQATVVLASVAPDMLVARLPRLWANSIHSRTLLIHTIYSLYHIVLRDPGEIPVSMEELRMKIRTCLEASYFEYGSENEAEEMDWLLRYVLYAVDRVEQSDLEPQEAWSRLRQYYIHKLENHADAEEALIRILLQLGEMQAQYNPPDWDLMWRDWRTVESFVQQQVVPFLEPLSDVLLGEFAANYFGERQREWLQADGAVRKLTHLVSTMRSWHTTDRTANELATAWANVADQLEELRLTIISGEEEPRLATLAFFVSACPTPLVQTLRGCIAEAEARHMPVYITVSLDGIDEVRVFCHETLLRNAIMQLIDNVATHRDLQHSHLRVNLDITLIVNNNQVMLKFRNTGTRPSDRPGKGIASFQRRLRTFSADLVIITPSENWTFEAQIHLQRWTASG